MNIVSLAVLAVTSACAINSGDIDGRFTQTCNDNCGVPLVLTNGSNQSMTIEIKKTSFNMLTGESEETTYQYGEMRGSKQ